MIQFFLYIHTNIEVIKKKKNNILTYIKRKNLIN